MSDSITRESTPLWRETIAVFGPCMRRIWPFLILQFVVLLTVWKWKLIAGYYDIPAHHHSWGASVFDLVASFLIAYISTVLCLRQYPVVKPPVFERRAGMIFFVLNVLIVMVTVPPMMAIMIGLDFAMIGMGMTPILGDRHQLAYFLVMIAPAAALCLHMVIRMSVVCQLVASRVRKPINNGWALTEGQWLRMCAYFFWFTFFAYVLYVAERKLGLPGEAASPVLPKDFLVFGLARSLAWTVFFAVAQAFNIAALHILYNDRRRADPAFILEIRHERPR